MNSTEFVKELEQANQEILSRIGEEEIRGSVKADILVLLRIALKNELEAFELAAAWLPSTPELDVKLGLARQVGDEAKHFMVLAKRYRELGADPDAYDPRGGGYTPLYQYLVDLRISVERLAAGQFTREALAQRRNDLFIQYLRQVGDTETAALYEQIIQPDEAFHQELGRKMLLKYATTPQLQQAARDASRKTLEIAEKLRAGAMQKTGIYQVPGC